MTPRNALSFDPASKDGHRGLSMRLRRKRDEAIGRTTLLPLVSFPQLEDRPRKRKPFECPLCEEKARELEGKGRVDA